MKQLTPVVLAGLFLASCGEKAQEMKNQMEAIKSVAESAENLPEAQNAAEKMVQERIAKGDTIAMDYAELQKYLPTAIDGYTLEGEPGGSKTAMAGFSMSTAEQQWVANGGASRIKVTIIDYGGTQMAYAFYGLAFAMKAEFEDTHSRTRTRDLDIPHTGIMEKFNKDNKDANVSVQTRYRYLITLDATGQTDDQTGKLTTMATDIAKKFDGK